MPHLTVHNSTESERKHQRRRALVLTVLRFVSLVFIVAGAFSFTYYGLQQLGAGKNAQQADNSSYVSHLEPQAVAQELPEAAIQPTAVSIPKLKVNASLIPIGLTADNALQVPPNGKDVGWYIYGPIPGQMGPSILVGHYDWVEGASVFNHLRDVGPGDEVTVGRSDGSTAVFVVDAQEEYLQDNFATDKVYGPIDYAGLRLITCSGAFDRKTKHYTHNLVVYARLDRIEPAN